MAIRGFQGQYRWLSNFWPSPIVIDNISFATVEHAYQAFKATNKEDVRMIRRMPTPGRAKKAARNIKIREDWEEKKLSIMEMCLRYKFSIPELGEKLYNTGYEELVAENNWGDTYWGVCNGVGENHLGKLLMKIRAEIRDVVLEASNKVKESIEGNKNGT